MRPRPRTAPLVGALLGTLLGTGLGTGSLLPGAAPAGAHSAVTEHATARTVASRVTISGYRVGPSSVRFVGRVSSGVRACQVNRTVKLRQTEDGVAAGRGRTGSRGRWAISFSRRTAQPGEFRATAVRKVVRINGRRVVCKVARGSYDASYGRLG